MLHRRPHHGLGFTLVEIIVAVSVFITVVVVIIGIMTAVMNVQRKIANIQSVQDNIRYALELMTKEMRMGKNFRTELSCGGEGLRFTTWFNPEAEEQERLYYWDAGGKRLMRAATSGAAPLPACANAVSFTANDVTVERFHTETRGTTIGVSDGQPVITIAVGVRSADPLAARQSHLDLQTTVVQRFRDLQ